MLTYQFAGYVASQLGCPQRDANQITRDVFAALPLAILAEQSDVVIPGFGRFTVKQRKPSKRHNFATGEVEATPARPFLSFVPTKSFRDRLALLGRPGPADSAATAVGDDAGSLATAE